MAVGERIAHATCTAASGYFISGCAIRAARIFIFCETIINTVVSLKTIAAVADPITMKDHSMLIFRTFKPILSSGALT